MTKEEIEKRIAVTLDEYKKAVITNPDLLNEAYKPELDREFVVSVYSAFFSSWLLGMKHGNPSYDFSALILKRFHSIFHLICPTKGQ